MEDFDIQVSDETAPEVDLNAIIDHEVYGDDLPDEWNEDFYPFPKRDPEVVAQYL